MDHIMMESEKMDKKMDMENSNDKIKLYMKENEVETNNMVKEIKNG